MNILLQRKTAMSAYNSEYMSILSESATSESFYTREALQRAMRRVGYGKATISHTMKKLEGGDPSADSFSYGAIFSALPYEGGGGADPDGKGVARRIMQLLDGTPSPAPDRPHSDKQISEIAPVLAAAGAAIGRAALGGAVSGARLAGKGVGTSLGVAGGVALNKKLFGNDENLSEADAADESAVIKSLRDRIADSEKRIAGLEEANAALTDENNYLREESGRSRRRR
jgi:hypothetical protein